jgi:hypothetical protein
MTNNIAFSLMLASFNMTREQLYRTHCEPIWQREGVYLHVTHDKDKSGCWTTCRRAWQHLVDNTNASHLVVVQDDFIPCKGFLHRLDESISEHPSEVTTFFQPAMQNRNDVKKLMSQNMNNKTFQLPDTGIIVWGGCLVLPHHLVRPIVELADQLQFGQIDDVRLSVAMQMLQFQGANFKIHCTSPSLVKHLGARWESIQEGAYTGIDKDDYTQYREGYFFADDIKRC